MNHDTLAKLLCRKSVLVHVCGCHAGAHVWVIRFLLLNHTAGTFFSGDLTSITDRESSSMHEGTSLCVQCLQRCHSWGSSNPGFTWCFCRSFLFTIMFIWVEFLNNHGSRRYERQNAVFFVKIILTVQSYCWRSLVCFGAFLPAHPGSHHTFYPRPSPIRANCILYGVAVVGVSPTSRWPCQRSVEHHMLGSYQKAFFAVLSQQLLGGFKVLEGGEGGAASLVADRTAVCGCIRCEAWLAQQRSTAGSASVPWLPLSEYPMSFRRCSALWFLLYCQELLTQDTLCYWIMLLFYILNARFDLYWMDVSDWLLSFTCDWLGLPWDFFIASKVSSYVV